MQQDRIQIQNHDKTNARTCMRARARSMSFTAYARFFHQLPPPMRGERITLDAIFHSCSPYYTRPFPSGSLYVYARLNPIGNCFARGPGRAR